MSLSPDLEDNSAFRINFQEPEKCNLVILENWLDLSRPVKLRIYVADGAFRQGEAKTLSGWTQYLADTLEKRFTGLDVEVKVLRYSERRSIETSAEVFADLMRNDLTENPLEEDRQIVLLGHSQGAFIMSYLKHAADKGADFTHNIPWQNTIKVISVDPPLKVTEDYSGPVEWIVDPIFFVARHDLFVIPVLSSVFFPVGNDYLGNTSTYRYIKTPANGEVRIQRTNKDGTPVNPTVCGCNVDNYESNFEHDPFLSDSGERNRTARERIIKEILTILPLEPSLERLKAQIEEMRKELEK